MKITAAAICLMVMACASTPDAPVTAPARLDQLVALLPGAYQSSPNEGARAGRAIHQVIAPVAPPNGFAHALYSEMRHDGPRGPIYRQTLYLFAPDADETFAMTTRGFVDADAAVALKTNPDAVRSGAVALNAGLGPGCDMVWRKDNDGFIGRIDPGTCEINGRRGDRRRIESIVRVGPTAIEHAEFGYDLEGKLLFGGPPGQRFVWPRLPATMAPGSGESSGLSPPKGRGYMEREREREHRAMTASLRR